MKPIRFALSAVALCLALPAFSATTTTYSFGASNAASASNTSTSGNNTTTTQTGVTTFQTTSASQYGDGGSNYGNTITWNGSTAGSSVKVSAWSTTGANGKFETAYIGNYGGDLGVTSQPLAGNAELYTSGNNINKPNETNSQHAIDNVGAYDALVFSFQSAVNLSNVSIGFPSTNSGLDSDSTILYWAGTGDPTKSTGQSGGLTARTLADLTSTTGGWKVATNEQLSVGSGGNPTGISPSISSQYWMVGAYMNIGGPTQANVSTGADYFKVNGLTVAPSAVPEPDSVALLGIAAAALFVGRRRKARQD